MRHVLWIVTCLTAAGCTAIRSGQPAVETRAIMLAVERGDAQLVKALIGAGADVNYQRDRCTAIALMVASQNDHREVVRLLLENGADVHAKATDGGTALALASFNGRGAIVEMLLARGAAPDARLDDGRTPLMLAVISKDNATVAALLAKGADVNATDRDGTTPLLFATHLGLVDIAKALLLNGADPGKGNKGNVTPLEMAQWQGNKEMIALLTTAQSKPVTPSAAPAATPSADKPGMDDLKIAFVRKPDDDTSWDPVLGKAYTIGDARHYLLAASAFLKSQSADPRAAEVRDRSRKLLATLLKVPAVVRADAEGIPLANGWAMEMARAPMRNGWVDLTHAEAGLLAMNEARPALKGSLRASRTDAFPRLQTGMAASTVAQLLGEPDDGFEEVFPGLSFERIYIYAMSGGKTGFVWFNAANNVTFFCTYRELTSHPHRNQGGPDAP